MLEVLGETHNGVEPQALYTSMPKDSIDYVLVYINSLLLLVRFKMYVSQPTLRREGDA